MADAGSSRLDELDNFFDFNAVCDDDALPETTTTAEQSSSQVETSPFLFQTWELVSEPSGSEHWTPVFSARSLSPEDAEDANARTSPQPAPAADAASWSPTHGHAQSPITGVGIEPSLTSKSPLPSVLSIPTPVLGLASPTASPVSLVRPEGPAKVPPKLAQTSSSASDANSGSRRQSRQSDAGTSSSLFSSATEDDRTCVEGEASPVQSFRTPEDATGASDEQRYDGAHGASPVSPYSQVQRGLAGPPRSYVAAHSSGPHYSASRPAVAPVASSSSFHEVVPSISRASRSRARLTSPHPPSSAAPLSSWMGGPAPAQTASTSFGYPRFSPPRANDAAYESDFPTHRKRKADAAFASTSAAYHPPLHHHQSYQVGESSEYAASPSPASASVSAPTDLDEASRLPPKKVRRKAASPTNTNSETAHHDSHSRYSASPPVALPTSTTSGAFSSSRRGAAAGPSSNVVPSSSRRRWDPVTADLNDWISSAIESGGQLRGRKKILESTPCKVCEPSPSASSAKHSSPGRHLKTHHRGTLAQQLISREQLSAEESVLLCHFTVSHVQHNEQHLLVGSDAHAAGSSSSSGTRLKGEIDHFLKHYPTLRSVSASPTFDFKSNYPALAVHVERLALEWNLKCQWCGTVCSRSDALSRHLRTVCTIIPDDARADLVSGYKGTPAGATKRHRKDKDKGRAGGRKRGKRSTPSSPDEDEDDDDDEYDYDEDDYA